MSRLHASSKTHRRVLHTAAVEGVVADNAQGAGEVTGKEHATHTIRVAVPAAGSLTISTAAASVQGVGHKHCTVLQRGDGYGFLWKEVAFASPPCTSLRTGSRTPRNDEETPRCRPGSHRSDRAAYHSVLRAPS